MWKYFTKDSNKEYLLSTNLIDHKNKKESLKMLYSICNNIDKNYRVFTIPKKDGTKRIIEEPLENLKQIQRRIVENILSERKLSSQAKAYQKGIGIKENVMVHLKKPIILKLDIQDFFHSITASMVYENIFVPYIYPEQIRVLLTNLCTFQGKVPQGAPTSPYISNLILRDFDSKIALFCEKKKIDYTRYADDLTFSGNLDPKELIHFVNRELQKRHFKLNEKKIRILKPHQSQIVTGIVLNEKLNISKKYRREIRQNMYYIEKYGLESFNKRRIKERKNTLTYEQLLGKINFVLQINPENKEFQNYKKRIKKLIESYRKEEKNGIC